MKPIVIPGQSPQEQYHIFLGGALSDPAAAVVLVTDADNQFELLVEAYVEQHGAGRVRPVAFVGLGYGALYSKPANRRFADYTPTSMSGEDGTGGAPAFLKWIDQQLRPWLAKQGLDRPQFGLVGHSLGALFGVYAFFHDSEMINACLAVAPSLWYDNRAVLELVARHRKRHPAWPRRLVFAVGDEDTESMQSDLKRLLQQLERTPYAGLDLRICRLPGCDHYSAISPAFHAGLAALYPADSDA